MANSLLSMARDAALKNSIIERQKMNGSSIGAMSLECFRTSLIGTPKAEKAMIELALESSKASDCWINFTHVAALEREIDTLTPEFLWTCFKRGVAVQCAHRQWGIDGIIPVYQGRLDEPFGSGGESEAVQRMSYIGWQAKLRQDPHYGKVEQMQGASIEHTIDNARPTFSFFTIFLNIGTSIPFSSTTVSRFVNVTRPQHTTQVIGPACLSIRGVQEDTYPMLDEFNCRRVFRKLVEHTSQSIDPNRLKLPFLDTWPQPESRQLTPPQEDNKQELLQEFEVMKVSE